MAGATAPTQTIAERRITSVLFGDLVGFTPISEHRDAEDVRELLSTYFDTARTVIERYGGTVEKFIGDAVMAVWGVPSAHEDDAERAVRAGIDLVDAVRSLGEEIGVPGLAMRVGVVTGEVAVTLGATGQGMVAGDAVNTAARVQSAAGAGEVWVDETTKAATAAAVAYDDAGEHTLKGKSEPARLFVARTVVAAIGGARRVDGLEAPFLGRDRELRLVKEIFHATLEEGRPRLAAVFGPPGVGKSRLGWEFDKYIDGINDTVHWHRGRCLSYGEGVAFWALAEMVRGRLGILEGDVTDVVVRRLVDGLEFHITDPTERSWLLPRLATLIGVAETVAPGTAFARDDLFAAWRTFFERIARSDDSVGAYLQIDDLQWADQGLLDFIDYVLDTAQAPLFFLTLARSELTERAPGFGAGRRATTLYLEPLAEPAMSRLVDGLVEGLPEEVRRALVERSEGIPLFAVETVRGLIDRDAVVPSEGRYVLAPDAAAKVDLAHLSLPTTLHTLIASRLDSLPVEERRIVQDAAVLGQSFTRNGLTALVHEVGDDCDLESALASLVRKEIIAVESDPRSPERGQYRFVQALVRGVAYDTLARRDRKARHLAAAAHLASEPDADTIPAVLANHYLDAHSAAADDPDAPELARKAVEMLEQAATRATALGSPEEALRHLGTALGLALDASDRARLTEASARASISVGAAADGLDLAERARALYLEAGRELDAYRALALWGEAQIASGNGQVVIDPLAAAYAELENRPDAAAVAAQLALQCARGYYISRGDAANSLEWFDRAVLLGEALEDIPLLASTLASYAGAFVLVGRPRMGLGLLRVSLDLARELDDPTTRLKPLNNLVSFLAVRDIAGALEYAEEGLAIVHRLGDRDWGLSLTSSATHVFWTAGEWDRALALRDEFGAGEVSSTMLVLECYASIIRATRGEHYERPAQAPALAGARADVTIELADRFLEAAMIRQDGDLEGASAITHDVAVRMAAITIDDDFDTFWLAAVDDALAVTDQARAEDLVNLLAAHPIGHIPSYLRAQLLRVSATVDAVAGRHDSVERGLMTAESQLRDLTAPYYVARAQLTRAEWMTGRGRGAEAESLFSDAAATFERLGARPWAERARPTQAAAPGRGSSL